MYLRYHSHIRCYLVTLSRGITKTARIVSKPHLSATAYRPEVVERNVYDEWEKQGLFKPEIHSDKPPFSMVLPPPNITGKLHLGHALACTVQDVIVRRKRAQGHNVLWLPGTDHAGIATQGVVEKYLKTTRNISRHDLGREKFNKEVCDWKQKHGNAITQQLRTLGCSLDWSREMFTMDQKHVQAVNTAFIKLFQKGLIYRKFALVNWCNALRSTVSDMEVDNIHIKGPIDIMLPGYAKPIRFGVLYNFAYKVFDSKDEVVVSTTMPETMLGDVAVAVHPNDPRYKHLRQKRVVHPFSNKTIPIVFDEFVDMDFGTGAVKITPAHSKVDYEVAKRHNLPMVQIIDEEGNMINSLEFNELRRYDCRKEIVERLEDMGLMRDILAHDMTIPLCSRSNDIINYLPKEQWFVNCSKLNERAIEVVESGTLRIKPDKFVKNWLNWCKDDRDWCISRQLWWGQNVPGYKCTTMSNTVKWVAAPNLLSAKKIASKSLRTMPENIQVEKDSDVLDTWFSSAIYPFSALGWPENYHSDFRMFYPLDLMATGHDILGLWVHRMVILGLELTGTLPFENVLLHGIICDNKGAKMSKSKGNVIDPIDVINGVSLRDLEDKTRQMHSDGILNRTEMLKSIEYQKKTFHNTHGIPECGVDALRFTLLSQDIKSHFVNFDVSMCHSNKLFCNKIWQSVKYAHLSFDKLRDSPETMEISEVDLTFFDRWILSRLVVMIATVNKTIESQDFHLATKALRTFLYNEFCDVYIEATKPGFEKKDITAYAHAHTLSAVLNASLRCLNPFMVYLTSDLIPKIPQFEDSIIYNFDDTENKYYDFPTFEDFNKWQDTILEKQVHKFLGTLNLIRQLKGFYGMSNKLRPVVYVQTANKDLRSDLDKYRPLVTTLAKCSDIKFGEALDKNFVSGVLDRDTQVYVELIGKDIGEAVFEARNKLLNKVKKLEEHIAKMEERLGSVEYSNNEPEWTQMIDRENLLTKREELKQLQRLVVDSRPYSRANE